MSMGRLLQGRKAINDVETSIQRMRDRTYVLATQRPGRDPKDASAVGYILAVDFHGRVMICDEQGANVVALGPQWFPYTTAITAEQGRAWLEHCRATNWQHPLQTKRNHIDG